MCGSMSRSKEEFDDAARQPCKTVIPDPNLYKSGSMSRCGCSKARPCLETPAEVRPVDTLQSAWRAQKSVVCGTCIPSIWITLAHCAHLPNFESQIITYVNCLISTIAAHGAAFFGQTKAKKNYGLSKTFAPKPTRTMKCIGMYNSIFFELYMYNSIFSPIHSDTFLYILYFPVSQPSFR